MKKQLTTTEDLSSCMAKIGTLLESGHKVISVHQDGGRLAQIVVEMLIFLAERRITLDRMGFLAGLDSLEAEKVFGGCLATPGSQRSCVCN